MIQKSIVLLVLVFSAYIAGCATVPMASYKEDNARKEFTPPPQASSGLYIYRNSSFGGALKKNVYVDKFLFFEFFFSHFFFFFQYKKNGIIFIYLIVK